MYTCKECKQLFQFFSNPFRATGFNHFFLNISVLSELILKSVAKDMVKVMESMVMSQQV